jgi:hypothetical protein
MCRRRRRPVQVTRATPFAASGSERYDARVTKVRGLTVIGLAVVAGVGCSGDEDEFSIMLPTPMALEATGEGSLVDPCYPSKFATRCDPDQIASVTSVVAENPKIVDVTPRENADNAWDRFRLHLVARQAGQTTIRARAKFDDGTDREARSALRIVAVDEVRVGFNCLRHDGAPVDAPHLVQQGLSTAVGAAPYGGGEQLQGSLTQLIEAEGLTEGTFVAPPRDGVFPIRSRFVGDLGVALESFGPDRITTIFADWYGETPTMRVNRAFQVDLYLKVGDAVPCHAGAGTITTSTPAVCAGRNGETTWTSEKLDAIFPTALAAGTCQLAISPTGGTRTYDVSFEVAFD